MGTVAFDRIGSVIAPPWLAMLAVVAVDATATPTRPDGLRPAGISRVIDIVDGDTVILDGGLAVRLVGIQAPKLALGRPDFVDWPLAAESRRALEALVMDSDVELAHGGRERDRYGRALAHLFRHSDGLWVQREMVRRGLARVYSFADNRSGLALLLEAERLARAEGRGVWKFPFYRIRAPSQLDGDANTFQLVEGTVVDAATVRGRVYLNFGADWREDFTITIAPRDRRRFQRDWERRGIADIAAASGRRVRARGWVRLFNGPMIEATHPEQIEWLE